MSVSRTWVLPRVGCDWLSRSKSRIKSVRGAGWVRYRDQIFDNPHGKMTARVGQEKRKLILSHGDITERGGENSAIITSANSHLMGNANAGSWVFRDQGIGSYTKGLPLQNVDGAVHLRAGPGLLAACQALPTDPTGVRCPVGGARVTEGFELPAPLVIHAVGPRDRDETALQEVHLACLHLAEAKGLEKVFFPAISCGVYGFPMARAATVGLKTAQAFLSTTAASVSHVEFVLWDHDAWAAWTEAGVDVGLLRG